MKTLVILAHPNIEASRVNQRWKKELLQYPNDIYACAYGSNGDKLKGKKLGLAMSIGDKKKIIRQRALFLLPWMK